MRRIWLHIMVIFGGIVAACSSDITEADNKKEPSDSIDIIEIIDDTSSNENSFFRSNKTPIYFSYKAESSSSAAASSSSKKQKSSSSSKPASQSSSSKAKSSSSEAPSSSSKPKSSASLLFYDCTEHDCVTLDYLNPDVSYGELLDKRDNQVYRTLFFSNHVWTAQNMNYAVETEPATSWCYDNKAENCEKYGRLYTWKAAQKACPEGWHLPTADEWRELLEGHACDSEFLDDGTWLYECIGDKLKSTDSWNSKNEIRKNALGFSITGAGIIFDKTPTALNEASFLWSATDSLSSYAYAVLLQVNESSALFGLTEKENGYSVRCVKGNVE